MKQKTFEACMSVEREGVEVDIIVRGTVSQHVPARRRGSPENWSPAEGGDAEVTSVVVDNREQPAWAHELTDAEMKKAEELLQQAAAEDDDDTDICGDES